MGKNNNNIGNSSRKITGGFSTNSKLYPSLKSQLSADFSKIHDIDLFSGHNKSERCINHCQRSD